MYWLRDSRYRLGGFWRCAVRQRAQAAARYKQTGPQKLAQQRERYDTDPVYRIEKRLTDDARRRAATIKRRRERSGEVQE